MIKKISLYFKIIILLVCFSCDGIDCIHPADFGNMGYYNLKLNSNPFEGDSFKSVTISSSVDISASYVGLSKDCGANIIEANNGVYHWLDTGINIVDLDRKISLKIAGAANFCSPVFEVETDEDGEISSVQNVAACTKSVTKFHTGYLTQTQSELIGVENNVAKDWQPYFTSGSKDSYACSESESSEKSAFYLSGVDSFYISIPRPLTGDALTQAASQAYTNAQTIATENGKTLDYTEEELALGLGKLNSHSESGEHTGKVLDGYGPYILNSSCNAATFSTSEDRYKGRYTEIERIWLDTNTKDSEDSEGWNIYAGLFADLDSVAATTTWNLSLAVVDQNVGSGISQAIADLALDYNNKKSEFETEETERLEVKYDILADKKLMDIKQVEINNFITALDIEAIREEIMANITLDLEDEVIISNIQAELDEILEYYIKHMLDIYAGKSFDLEGYFNSIVVGTTDLSYLQQAKNNLTALGYEENSSALTYLENIYTSYLSDIGAKVAETTSISAWYEVLQPELESLEQKLNSNYSEVYAEIGVLGANKNIYEEMSNLLAEDQLDGKTANQISFEYTINSLVESVFKLFLGEQLSFNRNAIYSLFDDKNIENSLYEKNNINAYLAKSDIETLSAYIYAKLITYYDDIKAVVDGSFITETTQNELDESQNLLLNIAKANEYYEGLIEAESSALLDGSAASTEAFIKNPYPPIDLIVSENTCANDSSRYFYTIDYAASGAAAEGINENMYNYCDKDVFLYNSPTALSGYIKFKLPESDKIVSEYGCCAGEYFSSKGPHCNCRSTGSKGGEWLKINQSQGYCGSPSESGGRAWRAGCWEKFNSCHIPNDNTFGSACSTALSDDCPVTIPQVCVNVPFVGKVCTPAYEIPGIKYYGYKYRPDASIHYDNLMDNFGEYDIEVGTPTSCLKSFSNVEFRIGEDIATNRRILDSANYIGVPWNTGRLFVRVVDDSILQQDNRECAWFEDDNLVIAADGTVDSSLKDLYKNNAGTYKITILAAKEVKAITQLKNILQSKFEDTGIFADEYRESFYESLIAEGSTFQSLLLIAMTLYIALTAATFLLGLTQITQTDLLFRVLKIGLIYTLLTPGSWEYFSYFIKIFEEGSVELSSIIAGSFLDIDSSDTTLGLEPEDIIYGLIDEIVDLFFQPPIHFKISAVFFSPIFIGVILFVLIYYALFLVLYAIGKSIILYFIIKLVFVMLFMVGPIFIVFSLFERTKGMFDNWLNMVISYSIQLLFLFITIAFFSYLIVDIFYQMFFYGVCWKPVWIIKIGILPEFEFFSFWRLHGFDPRYSASYNVSRGPDLTTVLFFLVIAYAFKELVEKVTALGNKLSGGGGVAAGDLGQQMMKDTFGAIGDIGGSLRKRLISPVLGGAAYSAFQITKGMARAGDRTSTRATNLGLSAPSRAFNAGLSATSSVLSDTFNIAKNTALLVPNFVKNTGRHGGLSAGKTAAGDLYKITETALLIAPNAIRNTYKGASKEGLKSLKDEKTELKVAYDKLKPSSLEAKALMSKIKKLDRKIVLKEIWDENEQKLKGKSKQTPSKNTSLLRAYDKLSGVPNSLEESYKKSGPLNLMKDKLGTRTVPSGRGKSYDDKVRGYVSKEIKEAREFTKNSAMSNKEAQKAIRARVKKKLEKYEMSDSKRKAIHESLDRDDFTYMSSKVSSTAARSVYDSASAAARSVPDSASAIKRDIMTLSPASLVKDVTLLVPKAINAGYRRANLDKSGAGMSVKTALEQNKISNGNLVERQKSYEGNINKLQTIMDNPKDNPGEKARIRHLIEEISSDKAYMEEELKGFDKRREAILSSQRDRLEDIAELDKQRSKDLEMLEADKAWLKGQEDIIREKEKELELASLQEGEQRKTEVEEELKALKSAIENQNVQHYEAEIRKKKQELGLVEYNDEDKKDIISKLGLYRHKETEEGVKKALLVENRALISAANVTLSKDAEARLTELEKELKDKRTIIDNERIALQPKIKGFQEKSFYEKSILQVDINTITNLEKNLTEKTLEQEKLANYLYQVKGEQLKTASDSLGAPDKKILTDARDAYKRQLADAKKFEIGQLRLKLDTIDTNTTAGQTEKQRLEQKISSLESQEQSLRRS
ncbi:MAG: hypothetical protein HOH73_01995 [Alphaproteobacteria bacterium]|nr:hypothetical protein [Alphaproteobacteria bacterium]